MFGILFVLKFLLVSVFHSGSSLLPRLSLLSRESLGTRLLSNHILVRLHDLILVLRVLVLSCGLCKEINTALK